MTRDDLAVYVMAIFAVLLFAANILMLGVPGVLERLLH